MLNYKENNGNFYPHGKSGSLGRLGFGHNKFKAVLVFSKYEILISHCLFLGWVVLIQLDNFSINEPYCHSQP